MTSSELAYTVRCKNCGKLARVEPRRYDSLSGKYDFHDIARCAHCGATWDYCCSGSDYIPVKRRMYERVEEAE